MAVELRVGVALGCAVQVRVRVGSTVSSGKGREVAVAESAVVVDVCSVAGGDGYSLAEGDGEFTAWP